MMTKELYQRLSKYENYLSTARNQNYIRALTKKQVDELVEIGKELGETTSSRTCPKCLLDFCRRLAVHYNLFNPNDTEHEPTITTQTVVVEDGAKINKPKRTKKVKTDESTRVNKQEE